MAPLDAFVDQLAHRAWTQLVPLAVCAVIAGIILRLGLEKIAAGLKGWIKRRKTAPERIEENKDRDAASPPCCPDCAQPMVKRKARQGERLGSHFWGCSKYPRCRGTRSVEL